MFVHFLWFVQHINKVKWPMKLHNASTIIKISEIAQFYEPINRRNKIVNNNMLVISLNGDCIRNAALKRKLYDVWVSIGFQSCVLKSFIVMVIEIFSWLCDIAFHSQVCNNTSKNGIVVASFWPKYTLKPFSWKDLLIDLLGVSRGDKCHAIDHYACKFQNCTFFSIQKCGFFDWISLTGAFYWWLEKKGGFSPFAIFRSFYRLIVLKAKASPCFNENYSPKSFIINIGNMVVTKRRHIWAEIIYDDVWSRNGLVI